MPYKPPDGMTIVKQTELAQLFREVYPDTIKQALKEIASDDLRAVQAGKSRIESILKLRKLIDVDKTPTAPQGDKAIKDLEAAKLAIP